MRKLVVQAVGVDAVLDFDGTAAEAGWTARQLRPRGRRMAVSDRADGATVIADANRW